MRSVKLYTTMEHSFLSQKKILTVFRSFFHSLIFKRNINHCYISFLFLNFPASKCSLVLNNGLFVLIKFVFICGRNKLQIIFLFFLFFSKFGLSVFARPFSELHTYVQFKSCVKSEWTNSCIIQCTKKMFSRKVFFSKCYQISRKLRIWSYLLQKSLTENSIFVQWF